MCLFKWKNNIFLGFLMFFAYFFLCKCAIKCALPMEANICMLSVIIKSSSVLFVCLQKLYKRKPSTLQNINYSKSYSQNKIDIEILNENLSKQYPHVKLLHTVEWWFVPNLDFVGLNSFSYLLPVTPMFLTDFNFIKRKVF